MATRIAAAPFRMAQPATARPELDCAWPAARCDECPPCRSSLASKLSYLCFESETLKLTPWGPLDSVWLQDGHSDKKCYGHLWLIGLQQLRTLAMVAGFRSIEIKRSELSRSSAFLMLVFYPLVLMISARALVRGLRKSHDESLRRELSEQFRLNISPLNLTNKFLIAVLRK